MEQHYHRIHHHSNQYLNVTIKNYKITTNEISSVANGFVRCLCHHDRCMIEDYPVKIHLKSTTESDKAAAILNSSQNKKIRTKIGSE